MDWNALKTFIAIAQQGTLAGAWVSHALADVAILYVGYQLAFG